MQSRTIILALAIAALVVSQRPGRAQNYSWPSQPGAAYLPTQTTGYGGQPAYGQRSPYYGGAVQPVGYAVQPAYAAPPADGVAPSYGDPAVPLPPYHPGAAPPAQLLHDVQMAPYPMPPHDGGAMAPHQLGVTPVHLGAPPYADHVDGAYPGETCDLGLGEGGDCYYPWTYWGSLELLVWYRNGRQLPPLVTTSPSGTPRPQAGVLGQPGVSVLFGGNNVGDDANSGVRLTLGMWLDSHREVGAGFRVFSLAGDTVEFFDISDGRRTLARPFFNTFLNREDSLLVAFTDPGPDMIINTPDDQRISRGSISVNSSNEVYGGELFGRINWDRGCGYSLDFIGGYQYSRVDDDLTIRHVITSFDPAGNVPVGTVIDGTDIFDAENTFHGGLLGLSAELQQGPWTLNVLGKVGIGNMHQTVSVRGETIVSEPNPPPPPATSPGALLVLPTNTGFYSQDKFTFIPEGAFNVGYQLNDYLNLSLGYTFMYWSQVALAAGQIDRNVNPTQVSGNMLNGPADPRFGFDNTDFWVQGLTIGVNGRY